MIYRQSHKVGPEHPRPRAGLRRVSLVGVAALLLTLLLPLQAFAQGPSIALQPPPNPGGPKEGESCSDGTGIVRNGVCVPNESTPPVPTPRPTPPKEAKKKAPPGKTEKEKKKREADLKVTKSGPGKVDELGTATYEIRVKNLGPDDATGVNLTDNLPPGFYVTRSLSSEGCAVVGRWVGCSLGKISDGESRTIRIPVIAGAVVNPIKLPIEPGDLLTRPVRNEASVSGAQDDPKEKNNRTSTETAIRATEITAEGIKPDDALNYIGCSATLIGAATGPVGGVAGAVITLTPRATGLGTLALNISRGDILKANISITALRAGVRGLPCISLVLGNDLLRPIILRYLDNQCNAAIRTLGIFGDPKACITAGVIRLVYEQPRVEVKPVQ